jgi:hypothetical protein
MELHDALIQVSEIRQQMARSETFRGYRSMSAAISAAIAVGAAIVQPVFVADPVASPEKYFKLWISAAFVSVLVTAGEMVVRCRRSASPMTTRMALLVVEQFLPCTLVGGAVTLVLNLGASDGLWMLPGLWGLFFSLGLFASTRFLPRPIFAVALYYFACGLAALAFGRGEWAYSPWIMAIMFGGGQWMTAIILYLTLERPHGSA